jgi:parallel beta-helix repeat protein
MEREMKREFIIMLLTFALVSTLFSASHVMLARASGTIYIRSDGAIDPSGSLISTSNKVTYTLTGDISGSIIVERSNIIIDGVGHSIEGDGTENGIQLSNVTNVTIKNTKIEHTYDGVYIESASFIIVLENNITANSNDGIGVFDSPNTLIARNSITSNGFYGVENINSSYCSVSSNHIAANTYFGIGIYYSINNNVTGNKIEDNYNGIELTYSADCNVYHNDFVNHTFQTSIVLSIAAWDDGFPSGGNYWSDYTGTDAYSGPNQNQPGNDGIGDTPYICDQNNFDNYPLMNPFTNIAITQVLPSKYSVGEGYKVYISVTVQNQGWNAQTTNLTLYANTTILGSVTNLALPPISEVILNFTWQTTPALRGSYNISSTASPVPNEPDKIDNSRAVGKILKVGIVGDINGDNSVDIFDAILLSNAFNSVPGGETWNGNADINSDRVVDIFDALLLSNNFNRKI